MSNITAPISAAKRQTLASDPAASAWVLANAGSGKTYVLVTRLVTLMLQGTLPERLLCLTYTRAAAAEMQERLFQLLGEWAVLPDANLRDAMQARIGVRPTMRQVEASRILFAHALETPGGLKVQTIHAFCESLLNRFPLEASVPPGFGLLDDRLLKDIMAQARRRLLGAAPEEKPARAGARAGADEEDKEDAAPDEEDVNQALALLTRRMHEDAFNKLIEEIVKHRKFFIKQDKNIAMKKLAKQLGISGTETATDIMGNLFTQLTPLTLGRMIKILSSSGANDAKQATRLGQVQTLLQAEKPDLDDAWQALSSVFRTGANMPRANLVTKKLAEHAPDMLANLLDLQTAFDGADETCRRVATYDMTKAIYTVALVLIKYIEAEKQRRAVLDYDDLIEKTVALLTRSNAAAWVLYKLDGGLDHILVDEAQDTSPDQWRVIAALAEEFYAGFGARDLARTVFGVGDEKQSIFSFQGADPAGFDKMREHFSARAALVDQPFHALAFDISYRSAPEILQFVDHVAARPEMRESLTAQKLKISHVAERQVKGLVEVWQVEKSVKQEVGDLWSKPEVASQMTPRETVARRIAQKIGGWVTDASSNIRPRDILILVQNRDAFVQDMLRALKDNNIAVAGADRMKLMSQIAVMDLIALSEAVLLPQDDLALAVFLRSPLGGLSEKQLFNLRQRVAQKDEGTHLIDQLRAASLEKSLEDESGNKAAHTSYKAAYQLYRQLQNDAATLAPYEFYTRLLGAKGGREALVARLGVEVDDPVNEFLALALDYEHEETASLQGFLYWVQNADVEIKRDMEQGVDAVRIMTVHGAKGLEAPIVFLPDTCRAPKKSSLNKSALLRDGKQQALFWRAHKASLSTFGASENALADAATAREHKRLLYVAMTRARDRLYIAGFLGANRSKPPEDSWHQILGETIEQHGKKNEDGAGGGDGDGTGDGATVWQLGDAQNCQPLALTDALTDVLTDVPDAPPTPDNAHLPDWVNRDAPHEAPAIDIENPSQILPTSHAESYRLTQLTGLNNGAARKRGELAHGLLEGLSMMMVDKATPISAIRKRAHAYLETRDLSEADLTPAARNALVDEVMQVLDMPFMALTPQTDMRHEVPINGILPTSSGGKRHFSGRIDRYVETPDEIRLVDYKTNRTAPASTAEVPPLYVAQMGLYRALLLAAGVRKPISCWLVWTATAQVREIKIADMEAMVATILK